MTATGFTHVSGHAHDLDESVRFYKELFGMEELPAPGFPFPVRWLRVGDLIKIVVAALALPGGWALARRRD